MSIYLERHAARAAELLKYVETIRLASVQFSGFGWRTYDEQFRLRHAVNPASSWGIMDIELWVTVAAAASIVSATPSPRPNTNRYSTFGPTKHPCHTKLCRFRRLISRPQVLNLSMEQ